MVNLFNYIERKSPIHDLTGATKLICLILWSVASMMTYDTRFLAALVVISFVLFAIGKIHIKDVSFMLALTAAFIGLNLILLYIFSPQHGSELYGTQTYLLGISGAYAPTAEQLFYMLNYLLKYMSMIPVVLLFVSTTNPSEFAASLNKIGVRYSIAYAVALAIRYIPDVQQQYHEISQAQQARGIEMTKKASTISRIKSVMAILIPLIISSMDKIEIISNAMELRSFGKNKKRTWCMERRFTKFDTLSIAFSVLLVAVAIVLNIINGGRFYNPFI